MNTSQLLLVSSIGLAINLFGMFAMGGHHHVTIFICCCFRFLIFSFCQGGHSHSHDHSHAHNHSQKQTIEHPQAAVSDDTSSEHSHSPTRRDGSPPVSRRLHSSPQTTSHLHPPSPHIQAAARKTHKSHKRLFTGPQLQLDGLASDFEDVVATTSPETPATQDFSPITPNYKFGKDDHFEEHHSHGHAPNLHDHSHVHHHPHGHSHNMRGVFLHVMAVRLHVFAISLLLTIGKGHPRFRWGHFVDTFN
jgi:zinc transporter 5/7